MLEDISLAPEEINKAELQGHEQWTDAMANFWESQDQPYPEKEHHFTKRSIANTATDKAIGGGLSLCKHTKLKDSRMQRGNLVRLYSFHEKNGKP